MTFQHFSTNLYSRTTGRIGLIFNRFSLSVSVYLLFRIETSLVGLTQWFLDKSRKRFCALFGDVIRFICCVFEKVTKSGFNELENVFIIFLLYSFYSLTQISIQPFPLCIITFGVNVIIFKSGFTFRLSAQLCSRRNIHQFIKNSFLKIFELHCTIFYFDVFSSYSIHY